MEDTSARRGPSVPPPGLKASAYAHLSREALLQVFSDLLAEIDPSLKVEIQLEHPTQTLTRILEFLRILKYLPPEDVTTEFRNGILEGNPDVILPIMEWISSRKEILIKRAYLANFLIKLEIPEEMKDDQAVLKAFYKYEATIEKFIQVHKEHEELKNHPSVSSLMARIQEHESKIDSVRRKLELMKSRENTNQFNAVQLNQARALREARDKKVELSLRLKEEAQYFRLSEELRQTARKEYHSIHNQFKTSTPETLMEQAEADLHNLRRNVNRNMPRAMKDVERRINALHAVESHPPESQNDLKYLKIKVHDVKKDMQELEVRKKEKEKDQPLFLAKQKSDVSSEKREKLHTKFEDLNLRLNETKDQIEDNLEYREKKQREKEDKDEQYREFHAALKNKHKIYKAKKHELSNLKIETGLLTSTKFILNGKLQESEQKLGKTPKILANVTESIEQRELLEELSSEKVIQDKKILSELSSKSKAIFEEIDERKTELEPLVQTVKKLRGQVKIEEMKCDRLKQKYEKIRRETERDMEPLIKQIRVHQSKMSEDEINYLQLKARITILKTKNKRLALEKTFQMREKKNPTDRIRSTKQKLLLKIVEEERHSQDLERELAQEYANYSVDQRAMWMDTARILKWKLEWREEQKQFALEDHDSNSNYDDYDI